MCRLNILAPSVFRLLLLNFFAMCIYHGYQMQMFLDVYVLLMHRKFLLNCSLNQLAWFTGLELK